MEMHVLGVVRINYSFAWTRQLEATRVCGAVVWVALYWLRAFVPLHWRCQTAAVCLYKRPGLTSSWQTRPIHMAGRVSSVHDYRFIGCCRYGSLHRHRHHHLTTTAPPPHRSAAGPLSRYVVFWCFTLVIISAVYNREFKNADHPVFVTTLPEFCGNKWQQIALVAIDLPRNKISLMINY